MAEADEEARRTVHTVCKVGACEPFCGIEVDVAGGKMVAIRPDQDHPLSEGYVCIKGMNLLGYQNSPDRVLQPLRRDGDSWAPAAWPEAIRVIGRRLREIADQANRTNNAPIPRGRRLSPVPRMDGQGKARALHQCRGSRIMATLVAPNSGGPGHGCRTGPRMPQAGPRR